MTASLSRRVLHAGLWSGIGFVVARLLGLARLAILARLIAPDDFGLFALAMLLLGGVAIFSDFGFAAAIVQKKILDDSYLSTAWHLLWVRGALLAGLVWLSAPWVAAFFSRPDLIGILHLAVFVPLLQGFESLSIPLLKRELLFRRVLVIDIGRELAQTVAAVSLAWWFGWEAMALVAGLIAAHIMGIGLSFAVHAFRPKLQFSMGAARELWGFGGHLLGAGVLIFAMTNLDNLAIGRMLGAEMLGYYTIAFTLAGYLTNQLSQLANQVMFPAYSGIQEETERMFRIMHQHAHLTVAVLTPVVLGAGLLPEAVVQLAVGVQWLPAIPAFAVLLLMGWLRGVASVFGPVLLARGRTRALHKMKWVEFAVFAVMLYPAIKVWGIVGAAWVLVVIYGISLVLHLWLVRSELGQTLMPVFVETGVALLPGIVAGLSAYLFMLATKQSLEHWAWAAGGLFVVAWLAMVAIFERALLRNLWARITL